MNKDEMLKLADEIEALDDTGAIRYVPQGEYCDDATFLSYASTLKAIVREWKQFTQFEKSKVMCAICGQPADMHGASSVGGVVNCPRVGSDAECVAKRLAAQFYDNGNYEK